MRITVEQASDLARARLAHEFPRRWAHVQAVAATAELLSKAYESEGELLIVSAWLHDIGYSSQLNDTGFHPLDGARYLRQRGVDTRICGLVACHSGAEYEAELRGLTAELSEFPDEKTAIRDALWACDMTTDPAGNPIPFCDRLDEIIKRYGESHTVPRAISAASVEIKTAIQDTEERARSCGISWREPSAKGGPGAR